MAGAFTSVADDAEAIFYNPAGLAAIKQIDGGVTYMSLGHELVSDNRLVSADLALPLRGYGLGAGFVYENQADTQMAGSAYNFCGILSYGMGVRSDFAYGLGLRYLRSVESPTSDASAIGMDVGMIMVSAPYYLGFSMRNWRGDLDYGTWTQELPNIISIGLSYKEPRTRTPISVEYRHVGSPGPGSFIQTGLEVPAMAKKVFIRGGYVKALGDGEDSFLLGMGVQLNLEESPGLGGLTGFEVNLYDNLKVSGHNDLRLELRRRVL
jgi:hypothetical protein